jgi:hypothetical protein
MTVTRSDSRVFRAQLAEIATAVRKVLDEGVYKRTSERPSSSGSGIIFYTHVKPSALLLGTDMYIELEGHEAQSEAYTAVKVSTESQSFIIGDVFGFYDRYIREFFAKLEALVLSA